MNVVHLCGHRPISWKSIFIYVWMVVGVLVRMYKNVVNDCVDVCLSLLPPWPTPPANMHVWCGCVCWPTSIFIRSTQITMNLIR